MITIALKRTFLLGVAVAAPLWTGVGCAFDDSAPLVADVHFDGRPCALEAGLQDEDEPEHAADRVLRDHLNEAMLALEREGGIRMFNAVKEPTRASLPELPRPRAEALDGPGIYQRLADATVMLHTAYKCDNCDNWHGGITTGAVIHGDGYVLTAAHILRDVEDDRTIAIMLHDGTVAPLEEIVLLDRRRDIAVVKIDAGRPLSSLSIAAADGLPGEDVFVMSHPQSHFYYLTRGIVSRVLREGASPRSRLQITAEYATGSSGAPVVDERCNIIGMVISTSTLYADRDERENPQMVIRHCTGASDLHAAID